MMIKLERRLENSILSFSYVLNDVLSKKLHFQRKITTNLNIRVILIFGTIK